MEYTPDGRIRYRLAFQDAPWLDSDDFASDRSHNAGDVLDVAGDDGSAVAWRVGGVIPEPDGVPDTLVMVREDVA